MNESITYVAIFSSENCGLLSQAIVWTHGSALQLLNNVKQSRWKQTVQCCAWEKIQPCINPENAVCYSRPHDPF